MSFSIVINLKTLDINGTNQEIYFHMYNISKHIFFINFKLKYRLTCRVAPTELSTVDVSVWNGSASVTPLMDVHAWGTCVSNVCKGRFSVSIRFLFIKGSCK